MIAEILLVVITLIIVSLLLKKDKKLPPGPWQMPIFGNFPVLYTGQAEKLRKKYGDIFMVRSGGALQMFIADFNKSKEAYSKMEFADRVKWESFKVYEEEIKTGEVGGVILSNGLRWQNSRRFLLRHLRDLGMGKSKLEGVILTEVENLVEDFKLLTKEPSHLPFSINIAIVNIIWQLVASKRYEFESNEVQKVMKELNDTQEVIMKPGIDEFFPILKRILPERVLSSITHRGIILSASGSFKNMVQPYIDDHLDKLDPNNTCDLMDDYLVEMTQNKSPELSFFSNDDLVKTTLDLFVAGNDTTATMTRWIIFYMAKFPEIQKKIQDHIDEAIPSDSLPGLEHREKLVYLDATINEVLRHCTLAPFGIFRSNAEDTNFHGYHIPKGTMVQSLAEISHKDPKYWVDPENVDPTRFLDSDGTFIPHPEGFQAFGLGKRQCLGEQLARMELFLILAALLQKFTFSPPEGEETDITPHRFPGFNRPKEEQKFLIRLRQ